MSEAHGSDQIGPSPASLDDLRVLKDSHRDWNLTSHCLFLTVKRIKEQVKEDGLRNLFFKTGAIFQNRKRQRKKRWRFVHLGKSLKFQGKKRFINGISLLIIRMFKVNGYIRIP